MYKLCLGKGFLSFFKKKKRVFIYRGVNKGMLKGMVLWKFYDEKLNNKKYLINMYKLLYIILNNGF